MTLLLKSKFKFNNKLQKFHSTERKMDWNLLICKWIYVESSKIIAKPIKFFFGRFYLEFLWDWETKWTIIQITRIFLTNSKIFKPINFPLLSFQWWMILFNKCNFFKYPIIWRNEGASTNHHERTSTTGFNRIRWIKQIPVPLACFRLV